MQYLSPANQFYALSGNDSSDANINQFIEVELNDDRRSEVMVQLIAKQNGMRHIKGPQEMN